LDRSRNALEADSPDSHQRPNCGNRGKLYPNFAHPNWLGDLESKAEALEGLESKAFALETEQNDEQTSRQDKSQVQFLTNIYSVQEEQGPATLDVIRIGESSNEISVQYFITSDSTARANDDYFSERGLLTWAAFDTEPKSIILDLIDDEEAEDYETIHVVLVNVTGDAILGTPAEAVLVLFDNDSPTSSSDDDFVSTASLNDKRTDEIGIALPSLGQGTAMNNRRLLPELGNGVAITTTTVKSASIEPCYELLCPTPSMFRGGVSKPDTDYDTTLTVSSIQIVDIVAEIEIELNHIGLSADILIVAGWIPSDSENIAAFFMLDSQGQVQRWSENLATLVAYENVDLSNFQPVDIYQGLLPPGQFLVFFGYRLENGLIVFNGTQAIEIKVVEY